MWKANPVFGGFDKSRLMENFWIKGLPKSNLYAIKKRAKCEERENSGFAEPKRGAVTG
ncbi:MAG: hypothetical protein HDT18_10070 [Oscillibacter sp.]|nr:hypothetical protein [Oscillibacter sp.]